MKKYSELKISRSDPGNSDLHIREKLVNEIHDPPTYVNPEIDSS